MPKIPRTNPDGTRILRKAPKGYTFVGDAMGPIHRDRVSSKLKKAGFRVVAVPHGKEMGAMGADYAMYKKRK